MHQFTVPQFIDVEDKIIGPVTTRQFVIMMTGFILMGVSYKIFDFSLFVTTGVVILVVFGVVSFVKINGRPFHYFVLNVIQTMKRPKIRVWNHRLVSGGVQVSPDQIFNQEIFIPKARPTESRLTELSLIVDTQGSYKGQTDDKNLN